MSFREHLFQKFLLKVAILKVMKKTSTAPAAFFCLENRAFYGQRFGLKTDIGSLVAFLFVQ